MRTIHGRGLGWHRDLPDMRDHTKSSDAVAKILAKSALLKQAQKALPVSVDLRAFGKHMDASRLFLYKVTRQLLGLAGDDGAYLRDTMKAMVLFGIPPEKY